ncbi:MAG: lipocalin family protein [Acidithiobacillus sp.]|jgi:apolipoprotein D and lipocalin family protein|uniref:lipocalin family protein n=1 Tax=Acidithiobacillus sp. TaxID=1872118 RepID=UPI00355EC7BB
MTEKNIDLTKYVGKWYEIESFPQWFQKGCADTIAEYTDKGKYIEVKNTCSIETNTNVRQDKIKIGKAFTTKQPDLLKVQFFFPFKGDYQIEHVDIVNNKYQNAIVGNKNKKYLWILSRNQKISDKKLTELKTIAKEKGYDITKLEKNQKYKSE